MNMMKRVGGIVLAALVGFAAFVSRGIVSGLRRGFQSPMNSAAKIVDMGDGIFLIEPQSEMIAKYLNEIRKIRSFMGMPWFVVSDGSTFGHFGLEEEELESLASELNLLSRNVRVRPEDTLWSIAQMSSELDASELR